MRKRKSHLQSICVSRNESGDISCPYTVSSRRDTIERVRRVGVVIHAAIPKLERLRWEYLKVCGQSGLYHEFQSNMGFTASPCLNTPELYK